VRRVQGTWRVSEGFVPPWAVFRAAIRAVVAGPSDRAAGRYAALSPHPGPYAPGWGDLPSARLAAGYPDDPRSRRDPARKKGRCGNVIWQNNSICTVAYAQLHSALGRTVQ
jgi:hypothetical protein